MSAQPLAILASGMLTGVGLTAASSCAAIRCAASNFAETRFVDQGGERIIGCEVPLVEQWRGRTKLVKMLVPAIRECLASLQNVSLSRVPLFLCVAEPGRPGRLDGLDQRLLMEIQVELGLQFHPDSQVIPQGKIGGAVALNLARQWMQERRGDYGVIAGVDSYLVARSLAAYEEQGRLLTSRNHNGFIPGEAGAAILVGSPMESKGVNIHCLGIGQGVERATVLSEEPLKADGLVSAIKAALADGNCGMGEMDFRVTDMSGEQYGFKEATLALARTLRVPKEKFDIWHPADCIGEVGAAIGIIILAVFWAASRKGYAPGNNILCHLANEDGGRAAIVLASKVVKADL